MLITTVPSSLFSIPLTLEVSELSQALPRVHTSRFKLLDARLGNPTQGRFILAVARERPSLGAVRALVRAAARISDLPLAVCWNGLDPSLMAALAREGIPFVRDENNVYLPFLGIALSSHSSELRDHPLPQALSPTAQRIFLNLLAGRWEGCDSSFIAYLCRKSNASVSHYLSEIAAVAPSLVRREGRRRVLRNPGFSKAELLDAFEPYLVSPIKKRHFFAAPFSDNTLLGSGARVSGISALERLTDLAEDPSRHVVAISADDYASTVGTVVEKRGIVEVPWYEDWFMEVDEWYYPPSVSPGSLGPKQLPTADPYLLYAEVYTAGYEDVRLADAVSQLREQICQ